MRSAERAQPEAATVAVVIPNWNGAALLPACLDALRRQTYRDHVVVVVDNGSRDASRAVLARYPEVHTIALPRNLGFGAATNVGIRATATPFVATLNNDAVPEPGWLAALMAAAGSASPAVGMWASRMVQAAVPDRLDSCGIALDRVGIAWDLLGGAPVGTDRTVREPFGPCAGAALYRRALLDEVGLFEERFFAYLEDVDLAWRARRHGWRCQYVPAAVVHHQHSATGREGSAWKHYLLGRNKVWLLARNFPAAWWPWLPVAVVYDLAAVSYAVVAHGDWAALRGRLAGLRALGWALRTREQRAVPRGRRATFAGVVARPAAPWRVPARYHHLRELAQRAASTPSSQVGEEAR
ncbi:MAG: glycosyltransferase family 2 protein [Chloroflexi bacterium]|nr:glycosyltransferase family 2 protein [Chloroflexota bacterium]